MGSKYIVRQPIKNTAKQIIGYEIMYYGENQAYGVEEKPAGSRDHAVADTVYNVLTQNVDKALKGSLNFMTFNSTLLMKKAPSLFEKSSLVIQIDDSVIIHPLAMHFVQQYAKEGYKIAVNEFQFVPRYVSLMRDIDYIKLNFRTTTDVTLYNVIEMAHTLGKKVVATEINSEELYEKALDLEADALEGSYVAETLATRAHSSSYLEGNFFRLMVAVTREMPDVEEIEEIISTDATLTYGLLRIANSAYYAMRNRVTTIRQAVMTLGIGQLKQWVYLLSASNKDNEIDPASEEFLKLSFMRANFCTELMDLAKDMPITKGDAYLLGMFSTLNYLIDAPLEEILAQVPLPDEIREALLHQEGRCGKLYKLVLSYERADWAQINDLAEELGIPGNRLTSLYFNCMDMVETTWQQLTNVEPGQEMPELTEPEPNEADVPAQPNNNSTSREVE